MKLFPFLLALATSSALASPTSPSSAAPESSITDINDCPTIKCPDPLRSNKCLLDNEGEMCWEVDGCHTVCRADCYKDEGED